MNHAIGKFAQKKQGKITIIDSVEKAEEYLNQGYEIVKGLDYEYIYSKPNKNDKQKSYYAPIISTLITGKARCIMYDNFKKIGFDNLIYTDTDSIIFKNHVDWDKKIRIGKNMGDFKIVKLNDSINIIAKKTYETSKETKISGIRMNKKQDFSKDMIEGLQMNTLKTSKTIKEAGSFKKTIRDLNEQRVKYESDIDEISKRKLYIDVNLKEVKYFQGILDKWLT